MAFTDSIFHPLAADAVELPERFTFPFYYEPHPVSIRAAQDLQRYLSEELQAPHNFGLEGDPPGMEIPKMFGVLVVKNSEGALGYLAAFSGKLADENYWDGFVPPIFDTLDPKGFYKIGEAKLNEYNREIEILENSKLLELARLKLDSTHKNVEAVLERFRALKRKAKQQRKQKREEAKTQLSQQAYTELEEALKKQSLYYHFRLKSIKQLWDKRIVLAENQLNEYLAPIEGLKKKRRELSASLQQKLHEQYRFLNAHQQTKDLLDIFRNTNVGHAPAGSGECAAPKLLQYAYQQQMQPIAMAEFWWGADAKDEVRKHENYYPACRGKCEPILGHMLEGLAVDPNPLFDNPADGKSIETVYEDEYLLVVHKPHEMLSVPGKNIRDSVLTRMQQKLPNATGPLVVHRLDMSTSGLMLIAKSEEVHYNLQQQFIRRSIKKRYVALLDGELDTMEAYIDLPLRVDLNDRPRQMVCYDHGKSARTRYEVKSVKEGRTLIDFYPITGRTHQLRVHAAHSKGLNAAIVGDDLYGQKSNRLHLHAASLTFSHPISGERMTVERKADF